MQGLHRHYGRNWYNYSELGTVLWAMAMRGRSGRGPHYRLHYHKGRTMLLLYSMIRGRQRPLSWKSEQGPARALQRKDIMSFLS